MLYKIQSIENVGDRFVLLQYCFLSSLLLKYFKKSFCAGSYKFVCREMQDYLIGKLLRDAVGFDQVIRMGKEIAMTLPPKTVPLAIRV